MEAEHGIVKIHAHMIRPAIPHRTALNRRRDPMPIIAPVIVCVVLTGIPNVEEKNSVAAAPNSAQNPSTGFSFATFCPIVLTIRQPPNMVPRAMAA